MKLINNDVGTQYIAFLHEHHIVHLDLADRNVLYNPDTKALTVIDFELSVVRPASLPSWLIPWDRTIPRMCRGEWPEKTRSHRFDPYAADIWSLGNMLMNEVPEKVSVFCYARTHTPKLLDSMPMMQQEDFPVPGFEALLGDMTAKDPCKRPKARQVLERYQRLLSEMAFSQQLVLGNSDD